MKSLNAAGLPSKSQRRIGIDITGQSISHEAIYQYCYRPKNRQWCVLLPTRRKKRKRRCDRRAYCKKNPDVVGKKGISERPKEVDARVEEGHWEGDCIIGKGQRSAVAVFVERASGSPMRPSGMLSMCLAFSYFRAIRSSPLHSAMSAFPHRSAR